MVSAVVVATRSVYHREERMTRQGENVAIGYKENLDILFNLRFTIITLLANIEMSKALPFGDVNANAIYTKLRTIHRK